MSPQFLLLAARLLTFLTGCLAATCMFAQAPAPKAPQPKPVALSELVELDEADAKADAETFVVGDWYKLQVKRRGVSAQFEGGLVKVNDQWIVLRRISEGRQDFAVPVVSKIPFVGKRLFKNVGIGRTDELLWIPRDAATVEQRTTFAQQQAAPDGVVPAAAKVVPETQPPAGEEPPTGRACTLQIAQAENGASQAGEGRMTVEEECEGDVIAVTDDVVRLMVTRNVTEAVSVPLVGELPIIGRAFTRVRTERHKERRQVDRADILCLRISNYQPAIASVELVPSESPAPVAPSPPMPK